MSTAALVVFLSVCIASGCLLVWNGRQTGDVIVNGNNHNQGNETRDNQYSTQPHEANDEEENSFTLEGK